MPNRHVAAHSSTARRGTGKLRLSGGAALLAVLVLVALGPAARVQAQRDRGATLSETFDAGVPDGWEFAGAARVEEVQNGRALVVNGPGHGVWIAAQAQDFSLKLRYRQGEGVGDMILRASEDAAGPRQYHLRLGEGEIALSRVQGGREDPLAARPLRIAPNQWRDVAIQAAGGRIKVAVGGQMVLEADDPRPLPGGALGFGCQHGSGFAYDNITLTAGEGPAPRVNAEPGEQPERPREEPARTDMATRAASETFDADPLAGWHIAEGAKLTPRGEGRALSFPGPGHGIWHGVSAGDFDLTFRYQHGRGTGEIVIRGTGEPPNHSEYQVRLRGNQVTVARVSGEQGHQLGSGAGPLRVGQWHNMTISAVAGAIKVSVGQKVAVSVTDPHPLPAGVLAFGCIEGSGFAFDDIALRPTAGAATPIVQIAQPPVTPGVATVPGTIPVTLLNPANAPLPDGPLPAPASLVLARMIPLGNPGFQWKYLGGPVGGLGYDIRMTPSNPRVMYVTDNWAGVFKSGNLGDSWFASNGQDTRKPITVRFGKTSDAIPVFCLTIDPHNNNVIWAGTKDRRGIFKSADGGKSWAKLDNGVRELEGISFRGFTVHPNDPNTVFAAGELQSKAWAGKPLTGKSLDLVKGVLYMTTNGGLNWERVWVKDNLARYVIVDPKNPNIIYVSTGIFDREAANSKESTGTAGGIGVLKSTDAGAHWQSVNNGLTHLYIGSLVMHPYESSVLLAAGGCNPYPEGSGVFLTTNGGGRWQRTLTGDIGEAFTSVEFAPSNPSIAYAGSANAIYRSTDGGQNWKKMTVRQSTWGPPGIRAGWPIDFEVHPTNPDCIFANSYGGGAFMSTDGGRTWQNKSQGYTGAQIRRIAVDPMNPKRLFVAGRSGPFRSADGGASWEGLMYPPAIQLDWNGIAIDPDKPSHVLGGCSWGQANLYESHDGGQSWRVATNLNTSKMGWRVIEFAPSNSSRVYAGTGSFKTASNWDNAFKAMGVYASNDGGKTWNPANNNLSQTAQVSGLAIHPDFPMLVYAATTTHRMLKTTDGGKTWADSSKGLPPKAQVLSVAINPKSKGHIYCGVEYGAIYRSTDAGATWQQWSAGIDPNASISSIACDPVRPDVLYCSDLQSGVYRRGPQDKSWTRINHGLRIRSVNALAFARNGSCLYAGTEGNGVYRLDF